jgi:hypothetical protein
MAKKGTEFISERPMAGGVADHAPAVIRVRLYRRRGGGPRYYLDNVPFVHVPVPAVLRHLDGLTVRGLALALLALAALGYGLAKLIGGTE